MQSTFINTAYNVNVEFPLAGMGKRFLAWMLDAIIRVVYAYIMLFLIKENVIFSLIFFRIFAVAVFIIYLYYENVNFKRKNSNSLGFLILRIILFSTAIIYFFLRDSNLANNDENENITNQLLVYLPILTYYLWQEILFNGRTVGKMAVNIRVISLDGYKPTPSQIVNRWLFRLFDTCLVSGIFLGVFNGSLVWFMVCFAINIAAIIIVLRSSKEQRIGDIIANTIVVDLKKQLSLNDTLYVAVEDSYVPRYPQVTKLNDRDISIIKDMLRGYYATNNDSVILRSYSKVVNALQVVPKESSPELFFERVVADYNYYTTRE